MNFSTSLASSVKLIYEEVSPSWGYLFITKWFHIDIASYTLTLVIIGQFISKTSGRKASDKY